MLSQRVRGRELVAALAFGAGLTAVTAAFAVATAADDAARDDVWRQIFARPSALSPAANEPLDQARVELGRQLFFDTRLSAGNDRSCASCHRPDLDFSDGLETALGRDGTPLTRNTPTLYAVGWAQRLFWDGRAKSLEEQVHIPITAPNELGASYTLIMSRLRGDQAMLAAFRAAFPQTPAISRDTIAAALASYERTILPPETRFDSWVVGNDAALTSREKDGLALFVGKAGCVACHGGWRFTDDHLHNIGLRPPDSGPPVTTAFKTPSLRRVAETAPYMHDGRLAELPAVLDHYTSDLSDRPAVSPSLTRPLHLSEEESQALLAFLKTL